MTQSHPHPRQPDQEWFYHRAGTDYGPMGRADLAETLRLLPLEDVSVWHPNFPAWVHSSDAGFRPMVFGPQPGAAPRPGLLTQLFSSQGRMGRGRFFGLYCLSLIPYIAAMGAALAYTHASPFSDEGKFFRLVLSPPFVWIGLALTAKRLHDLDISAAHLVWIVPALTASSVVPPGPASLVLLLLSTVVELGLVLKRGTRGANRYGADPLSSGVPDLILTTRAHRSGWRWVTGLIAVALGAVIVYALANLQASQTIASPNAPKIASNEAAGSPAPPTTPLNRPASAAASPTTRTASMPSEPTPTASALPVIQPNPFPSPRKVKTFFVHPSDPETGLALARDPDAEVIKAQPQQSAQMTVDDSQPRVSQPAPAAPALARNAGTPAPDDRAVPDGFDPTDIAHLLATIPVLGAPNSDKIQSLINGNRQKMSGDLWKLLDQAMNGQYKECWHLSGTSKSTYISQIKVHYDVSGRLISQPELLNPPENSGDWDLAQRAMRAVQDCNPIKVPAEVLPFYSEWQSRVLRFDPAAAAQTQNKSVAPATLSNCGQALNPWSYAMISSRREDAYNTARSLISAGAPEGCPALRQALKDGEGDKTTLLACYRQASSLGQNSASTFAQLAGEAVSQQVELKKDYKEMCSEE